MTNDPAFQKASKEEFKDEIFFDQVADKRFIESTANRRDFLKVLGFGIGTDGAAQLLQPVGAKGIATFGANIATTHSIDALYWNPAGLSRMQASAEGTFSTMNIFNDIRINYAAVAYNTGEMGALGVFLGITI